jgi:hypothetical protein
MNQETFSSNNSNIITESKKIKKKDKPVLKPIEQKKRGRKRKPVILMSKNDGVFIVDFS